MEEKEDGGYEQQQRRDGRWCVELQFPLLMLLLLLPIS
jgi:hypothetical protein